MKQWLKTIHVAKRELHLTDEAYRDLLTGAAGVDSASKIKTWAQYESAMRAFKTLGFVPRRKNKIEVEPQRARNPAWISAKQEYYIKGLWRLAARKKSEASLRAMTKRITGSDEVSWCKRKDAQRLILALREMAKEAGFNPDHA